LKNCFGVFVEKIDARIKILRGPTLQEELAGYLNIT
jgi:hypothetical protein